MAIIACATITLAKVVDVSAVTWYYKLQASTASPPAKPTTVNPSGWSTTEPTYTEGSTNSLYVCQKTTFSDGTFEYSDVSLSSSYEAAKLAYNKGVSALNAANGKNKNFHLPSTSTPTGATEGDQWFMTDKGNEVYKYIGSAWVKLGLTSSVFSTVDAGRGSVGYLESLLIFNNDDYWNLSDASYDEDMMPTSEEADIKYKAKTLQTHHLRAEEDVYVYGGKDSRLYIPTDVTDASVPSAPTDDAYIDINNQGMTVQAHYEQDNYDFTITTKYPSNATTTYPAYEYDEDEQEWGEVLKRASDVVHVSSERGTESGLISLGAGEVLHGGLYKYAEDGTPYYQVPVGNEMTADSAPITLESEYVNTNIYSADSIYLSQIRKNVYTGPVPSGLPHQDGDYYKLKNFVTRTINIRDWLFSLSEVIDGVYETGSYVSLRNSFSVDLEAHQVDIGGSSEWGLTLNGYPIRSRWSFIGSASGTSWVTYNPSEYTDLVVNVKYGTNQFVVFNLPVISDTWNPVNYYGRDNNGYVMLRCEEGRVGLWKAYNGDTDVTSSTYIYVHGR